MADEVASVDEARSDDPSGFETRGEPGWMLVLNVLRALAGGVSLVLGLLWILLTTTEGPTHGTDVAVGVVLAAGGLVLLMPHRIRLPGTATAITAGVFAVVGTAAGIAVKAAQLCCMFAYVVQRGWPFHWLARGGSADTSAAAYRLEQQAGWDVNVLSLAANLVLWAYAGMLLVVIAVLVRHTRGDHDDARPPAGRKKAD